MSLYPMQIAIEKPSVEHSDSFSSDSPSDANSTSSSSPSSLSTSSSSSSISSSSNDSTAGNDGFSIPEIDLEDFEVNATSQSPPLYPGSTLSVLGSVAILFSWFSTFPGVTKEALSQLLHILHFFLLPGENSLPATYSQALALVQSLLVPVTEYHCCVNDCVVFRGPYRDLAQCPHCGEERFHGSSPRKRFKYLPFTPRIKRYFSNARTSELLQSHATSEARKGIHDIHDTTTWKQWYSKEGIFAGDSRGLALQFCADGTNPFAKEKSSYSMWPILISFLNLPPSLRRQPRYLQLVGIIPGKSEPVNTDPYLDILVDELLQLHDTFLYDGFHNTMFQLKINLLQHVLDYPGQNKIFHCQGAS